VDKAEQIDERNGGGRVVDESDITVGKAAIIEMESNYWLVLAWLFLIRLRSLLL
jgi:hypothetical protein